MKNIVIITGGDKPEYNNAIAAMIEQAEVVICADSGGDYAYENRIMPNYLLGDFDSISSQAKAFFQCQGVEIRRVPAEKDFTDTQMAMELAMEFLPEQVFIFGGCGSRLDHSLGNILLFTQYLSKVSQIILLEKGYRGYYSTGSLEICGQAGQTVSLIPLAGPVTNLSLQGFYYPLDRGTLLWGSSRGISNVLLETRARITHDTGILFIVQHMEEAR